MRDAIWETMKPEASDVYRGVEWREYFTEHGCPEEPDAAPVRILVGAPDNVRPGEKLPLFFNFGAGILAAAKNCAELHLSTARPYISPVVKRFIQISSDTDRCVPEYRYPASINDAHAAYQWVIEHAEALHIDTDKIVWTGMSSGAHCALCMAFRMKRYGWGGAPMPRGLVLMVPVMDDTAPGQSQQIVFTRENGAKASWDEEQNRFTMELWLGDSFGDPTLPPEAVPNRAEPKDLEGGFPPVWIPGEAEFDPGRDSVYRFVSLLHSAGIFCDLHVWGGAGHIHTGASETDFGQRIRRIISGAMRDAVEFDFRRPWLSEKEMEKNKKFQ